MIFYLIQHSYRSINLESLGGYKYYHLFLTWNLNTKGGGPFTNILTSTWPITQQNHSLRTFPIYFCFILLSLTSVVSALEISELVYVKILTCHSLYNKRRQRKKPQKSQLTTQEHYNKNNKAFRRPDWMTAFKDQIFLTCKRKAAEMQNTGQNQVLKNFKVHFIKHISMSCIIL